MKKLLFFGLIGLIILSGCTSTYEPIVEVLNPEDFLVEEVFSHSLQIDTDIMTKQKNISIFVGNEGKTKDVNALVLDVKIGLKNEHLSTIVLRENEMDNMWNFLENSQKCHYVPRDFSEHLKYLESGEEREFKFFCPITCQDFNDFSNNNDIGESFVLWDFPYYLNDLNILAKFETGFSYKYDSFGDNELGDVLNDFYRNECIDIFGKPLYVWKEIEVD